MSDVISIETGPQYATRWIIKNEHGYFWDGKMWIPEREKALKFHDRAEAESKVFEFLNAPLKALNMWKFEATVEVEVFGLLKPHVEDLICHMWKTHTLSFFYDDDGPSSSIVLPIIKWDTMREARGD